MEKEVRTSNVLYMEEGPSVMAREVAIATRRDAVLGRVLTAVQSGIWPGEATAEVSSYKSCMAELSTGDDCLMSAE